MSNRFYQKIYLCCERCGALSRQANGYRPIPNPMLFDADKHCASFHLEQRRASAMTEGLLRHKLCSDCGKMHSNWRVLDHQTYLDQVLAKEKNSSAL